MEIDRGLTEYLYEGKGCGGIIKMRYSDFVVNEVDFNGNLVHFDSKCWNTSMKEHKELVNNANTENKSQEASTNEERIREVMESLPDNCDPFTKDQIQKMVQLQVEKSKEKVDVEVGQMSKLERTNVHCFVRKYFPALESSTRHEDDKSFIQVARSAKGSNKKRTHKGEFLIYKFVLYKENIATTDAISLLCKKLKFNSSKGFNFAGNKDKRGITTQEVTTTIQPQRLMRINHMVNNLRVGNFRPTKNHLNLGQLSGNHFTIVMRNIQSEGCSLDEACKSISQRGFINYFGMQRFGTGKVPTFEIGISILKSDWKEAVDRILSSACDDVTDEIREKLKNWQVDGNAEACVNHLGRRWNIERTLLRGLVRSGPTQLVQALNSIPRCSRLLYLHSYQSYVWNRMVSKRIKKFGLEVVVGDIVEIQESKNPTDEASGDEPECKKAKKDDTTSEQNENRKSSDDGDEFDRPRDVIVKRLTVDDDLSKYSISQVVLPLPGCDVIYPRYDEDGSSCWYKQMVQDEDGVSMMSFNHQVKTYYLGGAYRKLLCKVEDLEYEVIKYDNFMLPLMMSDKEKMEKKEPTPPAAANNKDGKFEALKISFRLPTSAYATVALRDVTKIDLGAQHQMEIEKEHKLSVAS